MNNKMITIHQEVYAEDLHRLAERLYTIIEPWDRDFSLEDVEKDIIETPTGAIKYLLELVEEA